MHSQPVTDDLPDRHKTLMQALADQPASTVADLARHTGIPRSTTSKILRELESRTLARRDRVPADGTRPATDHWQPVSPAPASTSSRLPSGALTTMVRSFLRDHPGQVFTPLEVQRRIGAKSRGAVINNLTALAGNGTIEQVTERPSSYRYPHPGHADSNT